MILPESNPQRKEESLWSLYHALQTQLTCLKIDNCIDLICRIHEICSDILEKHPNDQLALEMEISFLPSMIRELCDLNMERMQYIFGDID